MECIIFQIALPGDKKEELINDKTLSVDAQLEAVQAHVQDLEVKIIVRLKIQCCHKTLYCYKIPLSTHLVPHYLQEHKCTLEKRATVKTYFKTKQGR